MTSIFRAVMNFLLQNSVATATDDDDDDDDISALYCYKCWYCNFQQLVLNRSIHTHIFTLHFMPYCFIICFCFFFLCEMFLFSLTHSLEHFHNSAYFVLRFLSAQQVLTTPLLQFIPPFSVFVVAMYIYMYTYETLTCNKKK